MNEGLALIEEVLEKDNGDKDDLIHVVCLKCNPDEKALCGCYPIGEWVAPTGPRPEDCLVCIDLEWQHEECSIDD